MWGWHYGFSLAGLGMLAGVIVFWDGLRKGVFGDKGLQPAEYVEKKFFNLNIEKLVWVFGFLIVPIFAYLIVLEASGNTLGMIINALLIISIGYAAYLIIDSYKQGKAEAGNKIGAILILAVLCAIFWACLNKQSSLTVWADKCVNLTLLTATQTNGINPAIIILAAFPFALTLAKT